MNHLLDQATRLELAALIHEDNEPAAPLAECEIVSTARFALPRHALCSNVPRAPRHHWQDEDSGESILDGDEDEETAPRYAAHVLPSMRDRASVRSELRSMGLEF